MTVAEARFEKDRLAVMPYVRFPLSLQNVEDVLLGNCRCSGAYSEIIP